MAIGCKSAAFVATIAFGACFCECSAITSFDGLVGSDAGSATKDGSASDANGASNDASANDANTTDSSTSPDGSITVTNIKTVFVIPLTSMNWPELQNDSSTPYLSSLLATSAYATNYHPNPASLYNSLPNMIWLEAADNLGVTSDTLPSASSQSSASHLTTQLDTAGITWKTYEEDVNGTSCPLVDNGDYLVRHDPFVYFDDVTDGQSASAPDCIAHVRPYTELASDLAAGTLPQYVFIVPNRCHDMHDDCPAEAMDAGNGNPNKQGDVWLSAEVPKILASNAMKTGALFIVWDHSDVDTQTSLLPFIVVSPFAKAGYGGSVMYDHSSFVRSIETIFGVPFLRAAATANDFSDLFTAFP